MHIPEGANSKISKYFVEKKHLNVALFIQPNHLDQRGNETRKEFQLVDEVTGQGSNAFAKEFRHNYAYALKLYYKQHFTERYFISLLSQIARESLKIPSLKSLQKEGTKIVDSRSGM